jgi:putative transcriptional regulator
MAPNNIDCCQDKGLDTFRCDVDSCQPAEIIGVNFQTVGYLEREEYNPSLDLAFRISEHFGFPVEFVFSVEPMKPMSQELRERKNN